jgi:hypothetical protein
MINIKIMILVCTLSLISCSTLPRTAEELRGGQDGGVGVSKRGTHLIDREFSLVVRDVERRSKECLDTAYTVTSGPYGAQNSTFNRVSMKAVGSGKAVLTIQWDRMPRASHDPDGGYYLFVADINKTQASKTSITIYGSKYYPWESAYDAIKGWGEGKNIRCP